MSRGNDLPAASPEIVKVRMSELRPADSPRLEGTNPDHVRTLAEIEDPLPPITVHRATMRVIDGMHRFEAARLKGHEEIEVRFFHGDINDVFRLAVNANVTHGLPLTQAERQAATERIIRSHPHASDRSIARTTGLAAKTVARIRRSCRDGEADRRVGQDGRVRPLDAAKGRRIASRVILDRPDASLREIAQEAGISLSTARDVRARLDAGEDPVPARHRAQHLEGGVSATVGASVAPHNSGPMDVSMVIDGLRRDPSLRYSETGRMLLRWLGTHVITAAQARDVLAAVPPHTAVLVGNIARDCADRWSSLALELEKRCRESA